MLYTNYTNLFLWQAFLYIITTSYFKGYIFIFFFIFQLLIVQCWHPQTEEVSRYRETRMAACQPPSFPARLVTYFGELNSWCVMTGLGAVQCHCARSWIVERHPTCRMQRLAWSMVEPFGETRQRITVMMDI